MSPFQLYVQILQEASRFLQVMTGSTQSEAGNLYTKSPVRRTVYQYVPTRGTEKDPEKETYTRQEAACLLRHPSTTQVLTDFNVVHLMISEHTVTVDG